MALTGGVATGVAWCLVLLAGALRLGGGRSRPRGKALSPVEVGLLRGGARGAAQTALVELYLVGAVEAGFRQTVRGVADRLPPHGSSAVARAQYGALYRAVHPRRLRDYERVEEAIRHTTRALECAGLLVSAKRRWAARAVLLPVFAAAPVQAAAGGRAAGWLWLALLADVAAAALWARPRRTPRGATLLARLRLDHAGTRRATEQDDPGALLLSVALFGAPALRAQLPRFTGESGLLTRPPREPMERGGGGGRPETSGGCGGCGG
ncbi:MULTISPECIES: TIGR04222 domain-containing membrane protein [unclassified Streptomyces]|uniref:TIGR04222 domain-containing membrane protein n=1 Tax=unclassified Streptomyces TaxID=2593676 RepID=UPI002E3215CB|nr:MULTISPECIES: TIGR04222 domain-containing membrane protein [unclassified Streptomyces]WUC68080.1 TIGR04222 domain-containing membrane protein [Streptomyces sp. NBC_00539]